MIIVPFVPQTDLHLLKHRLITGCDDQRLDEERRGHCRLCEAQASRKACLATKAQHWHGDTGACSRHAAEGGAASGTPCLPACSALSPFAESSKHSPNPLMLPAPAAAAAAAADVETCAWQTQDALGQDVYELGFTLG